MSWIQENKFVAGLAGATAVISCVILYFGVSQGSAFDEKSEQYDALKGQYTKLEKAKPYPSAENLSIREEGIEEYKETIAEVRDLVTGYRPEKLEKMTPEQFANVRVEMDAQLHNLFKAAGTTLPDDCQFGFEEYAGSSAKSGATAKLNYELGAISWMLSKLAELKPDAVTNIHRVALPEESGRMTAPETKSKSKSKRKGKKAPLAAGRAYELMPMELSFTADEKVVRSFLVTLVNSKEYYYAIRGVRVRNEKQSAPNQREASFPEDAAPAGGDFGGMGGFGDALELGGESVEGEDADAATVDEPAEPVVPAGELILKQVLGNEKLHVHLCFDIVLIEKKGEASQSSDR